MKYFLLSIQFLTVLPVKIKVKIERHKIAHCMRFFPLAGACIGLILGALYMIISSRLNPFLVSAMIIGAYLILTGCLHVDGLADTFDGVFTNKSKKDALAIMHKGNIGPIGTASVVSVLLLKYSALAGMQPKLMLPALVCSMTISRWSMVFASTIYNSAGNEQGIGRKFIDFVNIKDLIIASAFMIAIAVLLANVRAVFIIAVSVAITIIFCNMAVKRIGGLTGDSLGALNEIVEAAILLTLTFLG